MPRRRRQFAREVIRDAYIKEAIGPFRLAWLKFCVYRNALLANAIDELTPDKYAELLPFHRHAKLQYTYEDIKSVADKLRRCCRVFHDGCPQFRCRLVNLCPFCTRGRAAGLANEYFKHATSYLKTHKQANYLMLCVKSRAADAAELHRAIAHLNTWRTLARRKIKSLADRQDFVCSGELDFNLLEMFLHISKGTQAGRDVFVPHLHILGLLNNHRASLNAAKAVLSDIANRESLLSLPHHSLHVRFKTNSRAKQTLSDLSATCGYLATMLKMNKLEVEDHLEIALAMPKNLRQVTGKKEQREELTAKFAVDRSYGKHTIFLMPDGDTVTIEKGD